MATPGSDTDDHDPADRGTADADHESAYGGLLVNDDAHWAFGTDFEDPLSGVDTTVPDGVAPELLATYCLMIGDDALVFAHRLSQWCSNAPDLEEDIALANIALDLLGQARLLLARAAAADPAMLPELPAGSPVPPEDALAFFRADHQFRQVGLVEGENGDFAETIVRILLFSCWRLALLQQLTGSRDAVLAAVATKGVKEVTYHRDFAALWFVTLAGGTEESRRRLVAGLNSLWSLLPELFVAHPVEVTVAAAGVGVDPRTLTTAVDAMLREALTAADLPLPRTDPAVLDNDPVGRNGIHSDEFGPMLSELQVVARAHPMGRW